MTQNLIRILLSGVSPSDTRRLYTEKLETDDLHCRATLKRLHETLGFFTPWNGCDSIRISGDGSEFRGYEMSKDLAVAIFNNLQQDHAFKAIEEWP
jgi:hypothetical protein